MSLSAGLKHPAFFPAFIRALFLPILIYLCIAGLLWLLGKNAKEEFIAQIPSETVLIAKDGVLAEPAHQEHEYGHDKQSPISEDSHTHNEATPDSPLYLEGLIEDTGFGFLPRKSATGSTTPFNSYKVPFTPIAGENLISLVVQDMGLSPALTDQAIETLPEYVTLSFSPYGSVSDELLLTAKQKKQEIWLSLPIENKDIFHDTGTLTLRATNDVSKNEDLLKTVMGKIRGYTGLLSMDADKTTLLFNSPRMQKIIGEIFERGIGYAYQSTSPIMDIATGAAEHHGRAIHLGYFYDRPFSDIESELDTLLKRKKNLAILINAHPAQLSNITKWISSLPQKGYALAPLSSQN